MQVGRGAMLATAGLVTAGAVAAVVVARSRDRDHQSPLPSRPSTAPPTAGSPAPPPVSTAPTPAPPPPPPAPLPLVPAPVPPVTAPPSTTPPATAPAATQPPRPTFEHVVQSGDTLSAIARRFGTTVTVLMELNALDDPNQLHVGQRLRIPGSAPAPAPPEPSEPTRPPAPAGSVPPGPPISRVPAARGKVAITFDDGPNGATTDAILATLGRHGARATFYVVGSLAARDGERLVRMRDAGHAIGNHSWDHQQLPKLDDAGVRRQLADTSDAIERATGSRPDTFRPPYGARSERVDAIARELGMRDVLWDVDTVDWSRPGTDAIIEGAVSGARDGSIILLHDGGGNREQTVAAVERIVTGLQGRGFELVTVPELVRAGA